MSKKYEGYVLFSDVDGTLMTPDWVISKRNIEALEHFTSEGGKFALATGRGPTKRTFDLFDMVPMLNSPCVLLNGALIYDSQKRESIKFFRLPDSIKAKIIEINKNYPDWPISVCTEDNRFQIGPPVEEAVDTRNVEEITEPWGKVLLHVEPKYRIESMEWLRSYGFEGIDVTASAQSLVEIVPHGISKGFAIEEIIRTNNLDRSKVAAIGDYYNDYDMLSVKGIRTFCPENAAPEIKELCSKTVCRVENGALADLIESL